jgi:catechol 2,3-dioxygenase
MNAASPQPAERWDIPGSPVLAAAPHRIGTVALAVRDLDLVARFYEEVIGLRPMGRTGGVARLGTGPQASGEGADGGEVLVELRHEPGARPRSPREAGLFHTAFLLPGREDLGAWVAFAAGRGIRLQGASDHGVSEALYLADPEGNGIEIYADRPSAEWRVTPEGVEMGTEPLDLRALAEAAGDRRWRGFPETGTVGHVHLQVGETGAAERFYGGLLGFDVTCRYPGASFFGSGGYHHQLAGNAWNSRGAGTRPEGMAGLVSVEVLARDEATARAAAVRLQAAGIPTAAAPGGFMARDPWGTAVVLRAA